MPKWDVWSKDPSRDSWQVVDSGLSESEARAGVERRLRTAARVGLEVEYVALPRGETPHSASSGKVK